MYAGLQQSINVIVIIGLEEKENEACWGKKIKKIKHFPFYTVLLYQAQAMNLLCRSSVIYLVIYIAKLRLLFASTKLSVKAKWCIKLNYGWCKPSYSCICYINAFMPPPSSIKPEPEAVI